MRVRHGPIGPSAWAIGPPVLHRCPDPVDAPGMASTIDLADEPDVIGRARARMVDSLIPVVQRSAGPSAVLRDTRLVVGVLADGSLGTRLVSATR
jgi:hypothetical protein